MSIMNLIPGPPAWEIPWAAWEKTLFADWFEALSRTPQNPEFHAEGDVWTHTVMVCEALTAMEEYRRLSGRQRTILFLAALLHDVGKIPCTRLEDGAWRSPHHASVGAGMVRQRLWTELGWCGDAELLQCREAVCGLIRYHTAPPYVLQREDGVRALRKMAYNGALTPGFSVELLCMLAEADALGRVCSDCQEVLDRVRLCAELAEESGCLREPFGYASEHTAIAYHAGRNVPPDQPLYDDTWGTVILMSGLPGTGKDTWIREHCPELPMISLDEIRRELKITPDKPQGPVIAEARERAKALLRRKIPFVWNATNITPQTRTHQTELFTSYGASVRIVYLETAWDEVLRRNAGRSAVVPETAIARMLEKLIPPERFEARRVDWIGV